MTRMGEEGTTVRDQEVERYRRRCRRLRLPVLALYVALLAADLGSLWLVMILLSGGFDARRVLLAYLLIGAVVGLVFPLERGIRREWRAVRNLGAWGRPAFQNPEAMRLLDDLERDGVAAIDTALGPAGTSDRLGLVEERRALAAAELVAASTGHHAPGLPRGVARWLAGQDVSAMRPLVPRARHAVDRLRVNSVQLDEDASYDNYYEALANRLAAASSAPLRFRDGSAAHERGPDVALISWAAVASLVLCVAVFLVLVRPGLGAWTQVAPALGIGLLMSCLPSSFAFLVAWEIWTARWRRGIYSQPATQFGRRLAITRRSLPVALVGFAVFWFLLSFVLPMTFPEVPIAASLPSGTSNVVLVVALLCLAVCLVVTVLVEVTHRPVWVLPADMRDDPDRPIYIQDRRIIEDENL